MTPQTAYQLIEAYEAAGKTVQPEDPMTADDEPLTWAEAQQ